MSHSTCIRQPGTRYIQIHEWQIKFCQNNHCAGLLLAFFIAWHDWKKQHDQYYRNINDIAEMHGEDHPHSQNAYLFFSMDELIEGCMGFYGKNAINEALKLLVSLKVIKISKNPNPRYHFDKTKYFKFFPDICNDWIVENYPVKNKNSSIKVQLIDFSDAPKKVDRETENSRRSADLGQPSNERGKAITDTTNKTTNKYKDQSIKASSDVNSKNKKKETQEEEGNVNTHIVIEALTQQGFSAKHFKYPDTIQTIQRLCKAGASVENFVDAYAIAKRTSTNGFGVNYLAKVVEDYLSKMNKSSIHKNSKANHNNFKPNYEADYSKGLDWIGELIE